MKLSPPWLYYSTEYPKLIYMKNSCNTHNLGQIDLKCYEHVLVASEMDKGLRLTQFGLNWSKNFEQVDNSDNDNVSRKFLTKILSA